MAISGRFVIQTTIGLLGVGFLTLLAIVGMTIWLGERSQIYFNAVVEARQQRGSAVEMRTALLAAESSQRGYIFSGNEIYLAPYDNARSLARRELVRLQTSLSRYREFAPMLARLAAIVDEKEQDMEQTIALKKERRDEEALGLFGTNRGKALMDEANVFLSGIIFAADERLETGVLEQRSNAFLLRWVSLIGGLLIVIAIAAMSFTVLRYAQENAKARDEVRAVNAGLEQRVKERTAALAQARDRAEMLLVEVNHRVANSLAMVASLVKLQSNAVSDKSAKEALDETQGRIFAISSVHQRLYTSGEVGLVELDQYLKGLLDQLARTMRAEGHGASLTYDLEPVRLSTDVSINLGVVLTEWVTNAFKYAYGGAPGEVRVRLRTSDAMVALEVEDDGIGRRENAPIKGTGLGTRIVTAMAANMNAKVEYLQRDPGTTAKLTIPQSIAA